MNDIKDDPSGFSDPGSISGYLVRAVRGGGMGSLLAPGNKDLEYRGRHFA